MYTCGMGHGVVEWLRHNATSQKTVGSRSEEGNDFYQFT
jgi:hypothetical protein